MPRFLFYISYMGTRFKGLQMVHARGTTPTKYQRTVQGTLEYAISTTLNRAILSSCGSSRTDSGVHALTNTLTVDLPDCNSGEDAYDTVTLQRNLNKFLAGSGNDMKIHKILRVDDNFIAAKNAVRRSYVYRLGIIKDTDFNHISLPVMEYQFAHIVRPPFDMDTFMKAAEIMSGTHNFLGFTNESSLTDHGGERKSTIKNMGINIRRCAPFLGEQNKELKDKIEFWEIHFHCKSFLYRQIRKMVGGLTEVARGKHSLDELRHLLKHGSTDSKFYTESYPPQGLFLKEVEYDPKDLVYKGPIEKLNTEYRKLSSILERYLSIRSAVQKQNLSFVKNMNKNDNSIKDSALQSGIKHLETDQSSETDDSLVGIETSEINKLSLECCDSDTNKCHVNSQDVTFDFNLEAVAVENKFVIIEKDDITIKNIKTNSIVKNETSSFHNEELENSDSCGEISVRNNR